MKIAAHIAPGVVVHAAWSHKPKKRRMTVATLKGTRYIVGVPEPVGDLPTLVRQFMTRADGAKVVLGFDFPIGVPEAYATRAGIRNFLKVLTGFGKGVWEAFYDLAESDSEISLYRPFYPIRCGGKKHAHLTRGLGVDSIIQLLRRCERRQPERDAASPLFWTQGPVQVGRAAIVGWRDVLVPAMVDKGLDVAFWPFQGNLQQLINKHACVVVETHPAEACLHLGLRPPGRGWKKGAQEDRAAQASTLLEWLEKRPVKLLAETKDQLRDGFGRAKDGEDRFDSLIGLLSMIEVLIGGRGEGAPRDAVVRKVEGWILGQADE